MKKLFTLLLVLSLSFSMGFSQTAPDFTFTDTNGNSHTLSEALANGKVVLLDFFFVDCGPCQTWGPEIEQIAADYEGTNLEVWALSDRDSDAYIQGSIFNPTHNNHFAGGADGGGLSVVNLFADNFNFTGFPTYALICSDNTITWDVWPISTGATEIRSLLTESCGVVEVTATTQIENLKSSTLYPNPAIGTTTLELNLENSATLSITLVNTLGQTIMTIPTKQYNMGIQTVAIDVSHTNKGFYIINIQSDKGTNSMPLIIE